MAFKQNTRSFNQGTRQQMRIGAGIIRLTHEGMQGPLRRARVLLSPRCWRHQLAKAHSYQGSQSYLATALQQQYHDQASQEQAPSQQQQQQGTPSKQLSWQELHRAAQIAAWSGLCYQLPKDLQARIDQQHAQLTLVAQGRNQYTSWFIADGVVPHKHFCTTVKQRTTVAGGNSSSSQATNGTNTFSNSDQADVCEVPQGARERFVFMRGVQWSAHDIDSVTLSQALMRMWPVQYPRNPRKTTSTTSNTAAGSSSGAPSVFPGAASAGAAAGAGAGAASSLVAHDGVAEIADAMFEQLRPYLDQADDVRMPICFAGHSLGGSLAMLTLVLYQWHSRRHSSIHPSCYTFGSPPVLAHQQGGGGHHVTAALGLPDSCIKNFVLENDPVPRALLSVDPTFELIKGWGAVKSLLQLRELVAGEGSPLSPSRFLFESVGQVHLIKWTPEGGSEVVPLDAHEIEQELSFLAPKQHPKHKNTAQSSSSSSSNGSVSSTSDSSTAVGATSDTATPAAAEGAGGFAAAVSQLMSPVRYAQAWLDHHHGSYAQELEAAALRSIKQQVQQQQQQAMR